MALRVLKAGAPVALALMVAVGTGTALAQAGGGGMGGGAQQQPSTGSNAPGGMNSPGSPGGMDSMGGMNSAASMQDKMFLHDASEGDMFEIQASQLALEKSNSADVKQFAQMMIDDHTKLEAGMKPIADEASVKPATKLSGKADSEYKKLQGMSGDAFDQEYIKVMVKDHTKASKAFGMEAGQGQLPDEKKAAAENKPVVDAHLQKAQQLAQAHNVALKD